MAKVNKTLRIRGFFFPADVVSVVTTKILFSLDNEKRSTLWLHGQGVLLYRVISDVSLLQPWPGRRSFYEEALGGWLLR